MDQDLEGGNAGGAALVDGTVRRPTGPWTPAVHALLTHLEHEGFAAPRVLGTDALGREMLSFLPGQTVGTTRPWPTWVHTDDALRQVGLWLRGYHEAVRGFVPPPDAVRPPTGSTTTRLVGFVNWDFAAPCRAVEDLAAVALSWVPLHAREVVAAEGFTAPATRPGRLRLLLDAYGWDGSVGTVLDAVETHLRAHGDDVRDRAEAGDPLFVRLVASGTLAALEQASVELRRDRSVLEAG